MVIKLKNTIVELYEKGRFIWKEKRDKLYSICTSISLLILLICMGMVVTDIRNYDYRPGLVGNLILSVFISMGIGIPLWYMIKERKWIQLGYKGQKTIMKKILLKQQIIVIIYIIIIYLLLLSTRWGGSYYYSYFEELNWYGMSYVNVLLMLVIPVTLESIFIFQYYKRNNETKEAHNTMKEICIEIQSGKADITNPFKEESEFFCYGETFENIGHAIALATEKRVKSEKMKVDLITNVSHDLKTPLTSIISFIDLIKKEPLTDEVKDYVEILTDKSIRLKEMIESLFELSKTTSGDAELKIEHMEMNRLVEQMLADMEDSIKTNHRVIKVDLAQEQTGFQADSKAMYRVFQNLFVNALKYSLENTRIYIRTFVEDKKVRIRIMNTAAYEMKFTSEDIVERFIRGDESRTSDGNGLGLTIAKTYVEACGGEFCVDVDGDQFKVDICFEVSDDPIKSEP